MKNVTISMEDDLAHRTRVAAAHAGKSVSKFLSDLAREKIDGASTSTTTRNRQVEALEALWALPKWDVTEDGRMPTADERNARS